MNFTNQLYQPFAGLCLIICSEKNLVELKIFYVRSKNFQNKICLCKKITLKDVIK